MTTREPDLNDAPACLLVGLAGDPRTHFTFPHPGHRCHAMRSPGTIDAVRQAKYCLGPGFTACDRYQVFRERAERERQRSSEQPTPESTTGWASTPTAPPAKPARTPTAPPAKPARTPTAPPTRPAGPPTAPPGSSTTVIHVVRAGDSLARIAAAYGLTVEQIATANRLAPPAEVVDGQRLVIPFGRPARGS